MATGRSERRKKKTRPAQSPGGFEDLTFGIWDLALLDFAAGRARRACYFTLTAIGVNMPRI